MRKALRWLVAIFSLLGILGLVGWKIIEKMADEGVNNVAQARINARDYPDQPMYAFGPGKRFKVLVEQPYGDAEERRAVVYLHGNADTAASARGIFGELDLGPHDLYTVEYPGFSLAEQEAGFRASDRNATAMIGALCKELNEKGYSEIVFLGHSLGGYYGLSMASGCADKLVALAPFVDIVFGAPHYLKAIAPLKYNIRQRVRELRVPTVLIHSRDDLTTPYAHSLWVSQNLPIESCRLLISREGDEHSPPEGELAKRFSLWLKQLEEHCE